MNVIYFICSVKFYSNPVGVLHEKNIGTLVMYLSLGSQVWIDSIVILLPLNAVHYEFKTNTDGTQNETNPEKQAGWYMNKKKWETWLKIFSGSYLNILTNWNLGM